MAHVTNLRVNPQKNRMCYKINKIASLIIANRQRQIDDYLI